MHVPLINSAKKVFLTATFLFSFIYHIDAQVAKNNRIENSSLSSEKQATEQRALKQNEIKQNQQPTFPVYINTGNVAIDVENYKIAKLAWIDANPEAYKQMNSSSPMIFVSKEEFNRFPVEKQQEITGHPEKYIVK